MPAGVSDVPSATEPDFVAVILRELCEASAGRDLASVVPPLCRAAAVICANHDRLSPLAPDDREALLTAVCLANRAAERVLPDAYFDGRGRNGIAAAYALLRRAGAEAVPPEEVITDDDARTLALVLRVFVNDLDSICVALTLECLDPTALPLSVLLGMSYSSEPTHRFVLH